MSSSCHGLELVLLTHGLAGHTLASLQVLRGLAYLREKHQIMHRGKQVKVGAGGAPRAQPYPGPVSRREALQYPGELSWGDQAV